MSLDEIPDWAKMLLEDKYPFLISDTNFKVDWNLSEDGYLHFYSRGFYYTAIQKSEYVR